MDTIFTVALLIIGCVVGFYDFAVYFNSAIDIAASKHLWLLSFMGVISLAVVSGIKQRALRPIAYGVALVPLLLFSLVFSSSGKSIITFSSFVIYLSGFIAIALVNKLHARKDS